MTLFINNFHKLSLILVILAVTACLPKYDYYFPSPYNPDYKEAPSGSMKFLIDSLGNNYKLDVTMHDYYMIADPFCKAVSRIALKIACDNKLDNPSLEVFLKEYTDKVNAFLEVGKLNVLREGRLHYTAYEQNYIRQDQISYYEERPKLLLALLPVYLQAGITKEEYYSLIDPTCLMTKSEREKASCSPEGSLADEINLLRALLSKLQVEENPKLEINPKKPDYSAKENSVEGFTFPSAFFSVDGKFAKKKVREVIQLGIFPTDRTDEVTPDVVGDSNVELSFIKTKFSGGFSVNSDGYSFDVVEAQAKTKFEARYKVAKTPDEDLGKDKGLLQFVIYGVYLSTLGQTALNANLFNIVSSNVTIESSSYISKNTIKATDLSASYLGYSYGLLACNAKIYSSSCAKGDFSTVQRAVIRMDLEVKSQNIAISGEFNFDDDSNKQGVSDVYFKSSSITNLVKYELSTDYPLPIPANDPLIVNEIASFKADLCTADNKSSCNKAGTTNFIFAGRQQEELDEIGGIYRLFTNNKMFVGSYGARRCENLNCLADEEEQQ